MFSNRKCYVQKSGANCFMNQFYHMYQKKYLIFMLGNEINVWYG